MNNPREDKESPDDGSSNRPTRSDDLMYKIDDTPPWYICCALGLQHYLTMFGATVAIPFIICPALCIGDSDPARGYIISTILFVSGIITLLQATFGCRLPIIQGGTFAFLVPTLAILNLKGKCPELSLTGNQTDNQPDN